MPCPLSAAATVGAARGARGVALDLRQLVVPAKLRASVLEANLHRQVVGVAVGPLHRAHAPLTATSSTVQQPHRRAGAYLARLQVIHPHIQPRRWGQTGGPALSARPAP